MKMNLKQLLISIGICVAVAMLSRFFMLTSEFSWKITIAAAFLSFLFSYLVSVFVIGDSRKRTVIRRYTLIVLAGTASLLYILAWNRIVCIYPLEGQASSHKIYFISGTKLLPKHAMDDVVVALNKSGERGKICSEVHEWDPRKIWEPDSVTSSKNKLLASFLAMVVLVTALVVHIAEEILFRKRNGTPLERKVFISYTHADQEAAVRLYQVLKNNDIEVAMDPEMAWGDQISSYIIEAIKTSAITLAVVSEKSLLSGWVATESINTFYLEAFDENKSFLACTLDQSFTDNSFTGKAVDGINEKISALDKLIADRLAKKESYIDLNAERERLVDLKNALPKIVARLKNSLYLAIDGDNLQKNLPRMLKEIRKKFDAIG